MFSKLKRTSSDIEKLQKAVESVSTQTNNEDDNEKNYWRPAVDQAGNGMAIFRFLPAPAADHDPAKPDEDPLPWAKMWSHGFQGPGGKWYVDNCPTTKGEKCPVCEKNSILWNTGLQANKDIVSKQKRRLHYTSNVYVVSDPKNPENEGRVVLFKYGKKIFDKIQEALKPAFPDEPKVNAFDMWGGANFKMKITKVAGYANYDKSEFEKPSRLEPTDEQLKKIWNSCFPLKPIVLDDKFKPYDELQLKLNRVLGLNGETITPQTTVESIRQEVKASGFTPKAVVTDEYFSDDVGDENTGIDFFKNIANQD